MLRSIEAGVRGVAVSGLSETPRSLRSLTVFHSDISKDNNNIAKGFGAG